MAVSSTVSQLFWYGWGFGCSTVDPTGGLLFAEGVYVANWILWGGFTAVAT